MDESPSLMLANFAGLAWFLAPSDFATVINVAVCVLLVFYATEASERKETVLALICAVIIAVLTFILSRIGGMGLYELEGIICG